MQSQPRLHLKLQIEGASPESLSKLSRANPRVKMFLSKRTNVLYVSNHSNCFGIRNCLAQCEFTDTQSENMFRNLSLPSNLHLSYIIYKISSHLSILSSHVATVVDVEIPGQGPSQLLLMKTPQERQAALTRFTCSSHAFLIPAKIVVVELSLSRLNAKLYRHI